MPISGLLLTLRSQEMLDELIPQLTRMPGIEIGEINGIHLPIVTDTRSTKHAHDLHEQLQALPQVFHVDVISVAFDEDSHNDKIPLQTPL